MNVLQECATEYLVPVSAELPRVAPSPNEWLVISRNTDVWVKCPWRARLLTGTDTFHLEWGVWVDAQDADGDDVFHTAECALETAVYAGVRIREGDIRCRTTP